MASNRIVHFEIPANQPEALTKFYAGLFGWKFQKAPIPAGVLAVRHRYGGAGH